MSAKFICEKCGTAVEVLYKGGCNPSCCGQPMKEAEYKTEDAAKEKHVPYITREGDMVRVEEHYIVYIEIDADGILMRKYLKPGDAPEACFKTDAKNIVAYEMCNKHGFWQSNQ